MSGLLLVDPNGDLEKSAELALAAALAARHLSLVAFGCLSRVVSPIDVFRVCVTPALVLYDLAAE